MSSRNIVTPRGSGELGDRTPSETQEGKAIGLAEDAAAPSVEDGFGEILPLHAPGEAVGDPRDGQRRAKVRYVLTFSRGRCPMSAGCSTRATHARPTRFYIIPLYTSQLVRCGLKSRVALCQVEYRSCSSWVPTQQPETPCCAGPNCLSSCAHLQESAA